MSKTLMQNETEAEGQPCKPTLNVDAISNARWCWTESSAPLAAAGAIPLGVNRDGVLDDDIFEILITQKARA